MPTVEVTTKGTDARYSIIIEPGALERLGAIVHDVAPHASAILAVDAAIESTHGRVARGALEAAGYAAAVHAIVANEKRKTLETVRSLIETMLAARLERRSPVVALGGGIVGDVAGFAAASYLRGVPVVQVPTTLLAMVDAAIGGKTGVNFPLPGDAGVLGKNLVGAFWPPQVVVADPRVLSTLPDRELRCGLAESVKHAVLGDGGLMTWLESAVDPVLVRDEDALTELVVRSASVKVAVVQRDEREAGERALLNLGHTFAHAIEPIGALQLQHGEAVAIGLCAAARAAVARGSLDAAAADTITALLERIGLPTRLREPVATAPLIDAMRFDKKVADGRIRLVLPTAIGAAEVVDDVPRAAIEAAWRSVGAA